MRNALVVLLFSVACLAQTAQQVYGQYYSARSHYLQQLANLDTQRAVAKDPAARAAIRDRIVALRAQYKLNLQALATAATNAKATVPADSDDAKRMDQIIAEAKK